MADDKYTSTHTGQEIDDAVSLTANATMGNAANYARLNDHQGRIEGLEEKANVIVSPDGLYYGDKDGNVALQYTPSGGLDAAKVSEHLKGLVLEKFVAADDGLYYTDDNGYVALQYTPASGFDVAKVSEHFLALVANSGYEDLGSTTYTI